MICSTMIGSTEELKSRKRADTNIVNEKLFKNICGNMQLCLNYIVQLHWGNIETIHFKKNIYLLILFSSKDCQKIRT